MVINANTKIASILKQNSKALDAIISISSKFEKLRNPLLRKLMAGRTTLSMASKLGGCTLNDFYKKLEPLGFEIDLRTVAEKEEKKTVPDFIIGLSKQQVINFDVRNLIASGQDPLQQILDKLKTVGPGKALKIINTFEPTPLILMLEKKGFITYVDMISNDHYETYFYKNVKENAPLIEKQVNQQNDWEQLIGQFGSHIKTIDVRHLEMPRPMHSILEAMDDLPDATALFVYHKRIPVFLLPELKERGFDYRIKEISDGEIHLLIYKNGNDNTGR
ncbi:MAG TPA: DUF2249 domain-containing protein [Flavisolibacter sp.]|nr:DUF2249 domain-containing protein [Flavisolibacter sp.]